MKNIWASILFGMFLVAGLLLAATLFSHAVNYKDPEMGIECYTEMECAQIKAWYANAKYPKEGPNDTGSPSSCCGLGDAYWADIVEFDEAGEMWVTITDKRKIQNRIDRDGQRIWVPRNKIDNRMQGNPTGHNVIFQGGASWPYCYFPNVSG